MYQLSAFPAQLFDYHGCQRARSAHGPTRKRAAAGAAGRVQISRPGPASWFLVGGWPPYFVLRHVSHLASREEERQLQANSNNKGSSSYIIQQHNEASLLVPFLVSRCTVAGAGRWNRMCSWFWFSSWFLAPYRGCRRCAFEFYRCCALTQGCSFSACISPYSLSTPRVLLLWQCKKKCDRRGNAHSALDTEKTGS